MRRVYKYECPTPGESVSYPVSDGVIIHVGLDGLGIPSFWVDLNTNTIYKPVEFFVTGTGWDFPQREEQTLLHAGSWVDGPFVWHLYRWIDDKYMQHRFLDDGRSE